MIHLFDDNTLNFVHDCIFCSSRTFCMLLVELNLISVSLFRACNGVVRALSHNECMKLISTHQEI